MSWLIFFFGGENIGIAIDIQAKTSDVIAIDKGLETKSSHSGEVLILYATTKSICVDCRCSCLKGNLCQTNTYQHYERINACTDTPSGVDSARLHFDF